MCQFSQVVHPADLYQVSQSVVLTGFTTMFTQSDLRSGISTQEDLLTGAGFGEDQYSLSKVAQLVTASWGSQVLCSAP